MDWSIACVHMLDPEEFYCEKEPKEGDTALIYSARLGHLPSLKHLVENCKQREYLETPLREAAREGHLAVVDYLYENGAKIEAKNDYGETALHEASKNGNLPIVEYLLAKGAQLEAKTDDG